MISILRGHVSEAAAPVVFILIFLFIGGASLWITPRLARWLDKKDAENKSYYDGMLTEDPNAPKPEKETEKDGAPASPKEKQDGKVD